MSHPWKKRYVDRSLKRDIHPVIIWQRQTELELKNKAYEQMENYDPIHSTLRDEVQDETHLAQDEYAGIARRTRESD